MNNIYESVRLTGPVKIFGTSKPDNLDTSPLKNSLTGWFYPLYITRGEAIQADLDRGGKGVYQVVTFYQRTGEFYIPDNFLNLGKLKDPLVYTLYEGEGAENPFKRVQNRLSLLIADQLPEFIQDDYGMFVTFLKAYYEFLEQNNSAQEVLQDLSKYSDIDTTSTDLIEKFVQNYANDLTQSKLANNKFLVKKIREIYNKKGTEPAYRLLFNILYKETISFFYPYEIVLKPSSGKWIIPRALRVKQTNARQNVFEFENTQVQGRTSKATAIVSKVIKINLEEYEVYELILDTTSVFGEFLKDEPIDAIKTILLSGEIRNFTISPLSAQVYSVLSKIDILDGGLGYKIGHPVQITDTEGKLAKATVNNVNRFGSITAFNIIESGVNYSNATSIDPGLPTELLTGTYSYFRGAVTVTFPLQHGLIRGKNIEVFYSGNIFSPIDDTSHKAIVASVPNVRTIRFRYPGI